MMISIPANKYFVIFHWGSGTPLVQEGTLTELKLFDSDTEARDAALNTDLGKKVNFSVYNSQHCVRSVSYHMTTEVSEIKMEY